MGVAVAQVVVEGGAHQVAQQQLAPLLAPLALVASPRYNYSLASHR